MIVAIDATPLTVPTGGIRRYTEELARALACHFPQDQFWLLSDQLFAPITGYANLHCQSPSARRWWSLGLPKALAKIGADVFHGSDFAVPYVPIRPSVLMLHDLSPFQNGSAGASRRVRTRTPLLLRAGIPTMVVTPSEAVRVAAIAQFGLRPERTFAIPLAASGYFRPAAAPAAAPYFLFVGTLEPRKNTARLIKAWREVRKTHAVDLVLAGRIRDGFPAPESEPGLRVLGEVSDDELRKLYSGALACVYPSLYEGFGLPVLEAMQCGALVITSQDPAISEVTDGSGMNAMQVNAENTQELTQAMLSAFDDCTAMRRRALLRASEFSWHKTALRTREIYAAAVRAFSHS